MFSRIRTVTGYVFILISILWLMGIAGADDYAMHFTAMTPMLPLMGKVVVGLIGFMIGILMSGGEQDEEY